MLFVACSKRETSSNERRSLPLLLFLQSEAVVAALRMEVAALQQQLANVANTALRDRTDLQSALRFSQSKLSSEQNSAAQLAQQLDGLQASHSALTKQWREQQAVSARSAAAAQSSQQALQGLQQTEARLRHELREAVQALAVQQEKQRL